MAEPIKQIFNADAQEKDLSVFKNIESVYSPIPQSHGRHFKYDMGFWSDVVDEWNLYWMGQVWQNRDNGWVDKGVDSEYDPFDPANLDGYEEFASKFTGVINKEHHDLIKTGIDKNLIRRERLEASDRGILPALVAGLGDPINWIPIPFATGVGFGMRFLKGGAIASGLVGATEPIRRSLDPTSTNQETAMYVAGSFILGGLLSGTFGKRVASETIGKKGGVNEISKNYFKAFNKTEGRKDFEVEGFDWKVGEDAFSSTVIIGNTNKFTGKNYHPVWMDVEQPTTVRTRTEAETIKITEDIKLRTETEVIRIDKQITLLVGQLTKLRTSLQKEANTMMEKWSGKSVEAVEKLRLARNVKTEKANQLEASIRQLENEKARLTGKAKIKSSGFDDLPVPDKVVKGDRIRVYDEEGIARDVEVLSVSSTGKTIRVRFPDGSQKPVYLDTRSASFTNPLNPNYIVKSAIGFGVQGKTLFNISKDILAQVRTKLQERKLLMEKEGTTNQGSYRNAVQDLKAVEMALGRDTIDVTSTAIKKIKALEEQKIKVKEKIGVETKPKYKLYVDEVHIRNLYAQNRHLISDVMDASPLKRDIFRTSEDFMKFLMKKEIYRKLRYFKKEPAESIAEAENRLNAMVYDDLIKASKIDQSTETNRFLEWVEAWTNYGTVAKLSRTFKDPWFARRIQEISGDFATATRGNRHGVPTNNSAYMEANSKWFSEYRSVIMGIGDDFNEFRMGNANSKKILDMNVQKGIIRTGDAFNYLYRKVRGRNDPNDPNKLTQAQYFNKVFHAVVDEKVYQDSALHPIIRKSADRARKFFKSYGDEAESLNMFASQGSYKRLMDKKAGMIDEAETILANKSLNKHQIKRLTDFITRKKFELRTVKQELDEFMDTIAPPNETKNTYATRMWRMDKIHNNPEALKEILRRWFVTHPLRIKTKKDPKGLETVISTDPVKVQKRVDEAFANITNEARQFDGENFGGWGIKEGQWRAGTRPLMARKLDIPNREVMEFIETDIEFVMRQYHTKMAPAIELTRNFGDKHLDNFMDRAELRLITKHLKKDSDNQKINKMLNAFEDEKDKLLGILNLEDPASLNKRSASFLRDWASLAFMGKVIFSAMVDMARPIAVNGFLQTFKHGRLPLFLANIGRYKQAIAEVKFLAPAQEIVMGNARKRYIEDGGQIGFGKGLGNRLFDKVLGQPFHKAQGPFYVANLLSPWTVLWKDFQGVISVHRLIEDSIKVSKNLASEFELTRLASYGIDLKTAKLIASMPHELTKDGLYLANSGMWSKNTGGLQALHKFRNAIHADVNRTIITPTSADQFNLMHGVFRVNDEAFAKGFDNPLGRWLGFTKTTRGGKFSNSYMGLPFQFFSWAVAANRKLLISGFQGREMNAMSGVIAMISFGMMGDYFKNPRYWTQKTLEEKIIRGVELSGVAGLFTDMNFMLETISSGMFDSPVGIRPSLGIDLRFGDPDIADALGEFTGAGPSIPADLLYAFMTDQDYDEKSATMRRLIPFNTLWFWDRKFKSLWKWGEDKLR